MMRLQHEPARFHRRWDKTRDRRAFRGSKWSGRCAPNWIFRRRRCAPYSAGMDTAREDAMVTSARTFLGVTMIGLGVLGLTFGDFALVWQRIPIQDLPGRT